MRIMREDNIFIHLINKGFFDVTIDIPVLHCFCSIGKLPIYLGKSLKWSIYVGIVKDIFSKDFVLEEAGRMVALETGCDLN